MFREPNSGGDIAFELPQDAAASNPPSREGFRGNSSPAASRRAPGLEGDIQIAEGGPGPLDTSRSLRNPNSRGEQTIFKKSSLRQPASINRCTSTIGVCEADVITAHRSVLQRTPNPKQAQNTRLRLRAG